MEPEQPKDQAIPAMSSMSSMDILDAIRNKTFQPELLRKKDRQKIVAVLHLEGFTDSRIAQILKRTDRTIRRDMSDISSNHARLVTNMSIDKIAGRLVAVATTLRSKSIMEKDFALAWKIEVELIEKLQSMGYIKQTPSEVQVTGKIQHDHSMLDYSKMEPAELVTIVRDRLSA